MKIKLPLLAISAFVLTSASIAQAGAKDEAYTACKAHISELYNGESQTKLKKVKSSQGQLKVKVKVSANGERFKATCLVSKDGQITYSSDQEEKAIAKS